MKSFIDNVNFHELEAQKYWTPPASWAPDRKKDEIYNAIFSGDYVAPGKWTVHFINSLKMKMAIWNSLGAVKA